MNYALYSGAGNTFAVVPHLISSSAARALCSACHVDGVLCSEDNESIHIFNRDGSSAASCGNGLRCFVRFLVDQQIHRAPYTLVTPAGRYTAYVQGEDIRIEVPPPSREVQLSLEGYSVHFLNTGVPHAVILVSSVDAIDLLQVAPRIRHHPLFPEGTNVNFIEALGKQALKIRTFERGVEGETLACGTGATAAALVASRLLGFPSPIEVSVRSGEKLHIAFDDDWTKVTLSGQAKRLASGSFVFNQDNLILSS